MTFYTELKLKEQKLFLICYVNAIGLITRSLCFLNMLKAMLDAICYADTFSSNNYLCLYMLDLKRIRKMKL